MSTTTQTKPGSPFGAAPAGTAENAPGPSRTAEGYVTACAAWKDAPDPRIEAVLDERDATIAALRGDTERKPEFVQRDIEAAAETAEAAITARAADLLKEAERERDSARGQLMAAVIDYPTLGRDASDNDRTRLLLKRLDRLERVTFEDRLERRLATADLSEIDDLVAETELRADPDLTRLALRQAERRFRDALATVPDHNRAGSTHLRRFSQYAHRLAEHGKQHPTLAERARHIDAAHARKRQRIEQHAQHAIAHLRVRGDR